MSHAQDQNNVLNKRYQMSATQMSLSYSVQLHNKIGKKPPSQYIGEFSEGNTPMDKALKPHLIEDRSEFGIDEDVYEVFILKRSHSISSMLNKKLGV